jgi:hypothetical protein
MTPRYATTSLTQPADHDLCIDPLNPPLPEPKVGRWRGVHRRLASRPVLGGVANDGREFALWLSPHILSNTARVLSRAGVGHAKVEEYIAVLAEYSGGGVLEPARTVHDCADPNANRAVDRADHFR